ncbi:ATP-binding protein [Bacteroides sp. GD17]|jgi:signal transduction histidine kinase|uniref:sensor histidine kinase n=1 Tax=Bacteroides sp. GD17 TaxID=3139826 RepID=UPI0025DACCE3|nr:ATP-binding protein [uncultured Bacteroides sp.]
MRIHPSFKCISFFLLFLATFLSASAGETDKDYILLLNSINKEEAWTKSFSDELHRRISKQEMVLKEFFLSIPLLNDEEEVKQLQEKVLQTFPDPPKAVVIIGDPGWMVSAPLFCGPWKDIPVVLCYSRKKVPADLQTLLSKAILTEENSIPIEEFNKKYNITVLEQPYFISETLHLIKQLQPDITRIAFISDHRYISVVTRQMVRQTMQAEFPDMKLEQLSSDILNTEQLLDTLKTYGKTAGIIYYSWFQQYGKRENYYLSDHLKKILPTFLEVPIFTIADLNLQENLFAGGHYISISDFTDTTMSVINRILDGEPASSIPYQDGGTPHTYLNYADLKWYNIPEKLYPDKAIYYHKPPTFYQQYRVYIWLTGFFILLSIVLYSVYHARSLKVKRELIKAKEHAEEADRLKSAFLANMSHEIRTPLNAIVGFSSILAETADTPENREYIKIIENNNYLLLQLINDILDLSKIEAGLLEFSYSNVDINHCLEELREAFHLRMPENVECILAPSLDKCLLHTEKNRVMQILGNYISNAIKYTAEGSITIGYYPPKDGKLRLFIRDTGCGIAPEKHQQIFERFVKLDSFRQGTGLGLSICRMIAEKMGATVGICSEVGKGSEFWLEIPVHPADKLA